MGGEGGEGKGEGEITFRALGLGWRSFCFPAESLGHHREPQGSGSRVSGFGVSGFGLCTPVSAKKPFRGLGSRLWGVSNLGPRVPLGQCSLDMWCSPRGAKPETATYKLGARILALLLSTL